MSSILRCAKCGEARDAEIPGCPVCGWLLIPERCAIHPGTIARRQCAVCGKPLCDEKCLVLVGEVALCREHQEVRVFGGGWSELCAVASDVEAGLIVDGLRASGFDAVTFSQRDHGAYPMQFGALANVRVLVPTCDYLEAIEAMVDGGEDDHPSLSCIHCGHPFEAGATSCSGCLRPVGSE